MRKTRLLQGLVLGAFVTMSATLGSVGSASAAQVGAASDNVSAQATCVGADAIASVVYKVDGVVVTALEAGLLDGATVSVDFTLAPGCDNLQVGLAAYQAATPSWDPSKAHLQVLSVQDSGMFSSGTAYSLSVTAPECYYQVDFFTGGVLPTLTSTSNYTSEGRLIDAGHGGTQPCNTPNETTTTSTTSTTSTTTSTTVTPTTVVDTQVLGEVVERPAEVQGVQLAQLAETGADSGSLLGLGSALMLGGSALSGLAVRVRNTRGNHFRE